MTSLKRFSAALFVLLVSAFALSAANLVVESARVHTATQAGYNSGANGCTVTGVTAATPAVITCANTHNFADGDQVQITSVGGTTTVNTTAFAKVTGYSTTTFGLYTTAALSTGVTGTGSYTSGGAVSEAYDVSAIVTPYLLRLKIDSLTANTTVAIALQDSADGFVNDIKTLAVFTVAASSTTTTGIERTYRDYMLPTARVGITNGRVRILVQSITSGGSVTTSLFIQN